MSDSYNQNKKYQNSSFISNRTTSESKNNDIYKKNGITVNMESDILLSHITEESINTKKFSQSNTKNFDYLFRNSMPNNSVDENLLKQNDYILQDSRIDLHSDLYKFSPKQFSPKNNPIPNFNLNVSSMAKNQIAKSIDKNIHKVDNKIVENY